MTATHPTRASAIFRALTCVFALAFCLCADGSTVVVPPVFLNGLPSKQPVLITNMIRTPLLSTNHIYTVDYVKDSSPTNIYQGVSNCAVFVLPSSSYRCDIGPYSGNRGQLFNVPNDSATYWIMDLATNGNTVGTLSSVWFNTNNLQFGTGLVVTNVGGVRTVISTNATTGTTYTNSGSLPAGVISGGEVGTNTTSLATVTALSNATAALSFPVFITPTNAPLFKISTAAYSTNITDVGSAALLSVNSPTRVEVFGDTVVVGYGTNVSVFLVTNRASPQLVATVNVLGAVQTIAHRGPLFYVAGVGCLSVINCAVPKSPVVTTNLYPTNFFNHLTVGGGMLFAASQTPSAVFIYSIYNPASPVLISTISIGSSGAGVEDCAFRDGLLYIADYGGRTLKVADISNPYHPVIIHSQALSDHGDTETFEGFRAILNQNALYLADDGWLQIFNLNNPTNPVFASAVDISSENDAMEGSLVINDQLLWCAGDVYSFDVQDPFNITNFSQSTLTDHNPTWIAADDNYTYRAVGGTLFITTIPHLPRFTGGTRTLLTSITNSIRFPIASNNIGRELTVKVTGNVTNVLSTIGLDRLELATTKTLTNGQSVTFQSDGTTNWFEIARKSESSGTITNALQLGGNPAANFLTNSYAGTITATAFSGSGASLTSIPITALPSTVVKMDGSGIATNINGLNLTNGFGTVNWGPNNMFTALYGTPANTLTIGNNSAQGLTISNNGALYAPISLALGQITLGNGSATGLSNTVTTNLTVPGNITGTGTASLTFTNGGAVNLKNVTNWGTLMFNTPTNASGATLSLGYSGNGAAMYPALFADATAVMRFGSTFINYKPAQLGFGDTTTPTYYLIFSGSTVSFKDVNLNSTLTLQASNAAFGGTVSSTNGFVCPSNSFTLSTFTNGLLTGDYKFGNSNGWPCRVWISNGVAVFSVQLQ